MCVIVVAAVWNVLSARCRDGPHCFATVAVVAGPVEPWFLIRQLSIFIESTFGVVSAFTLWFLPLVLSRFFWFMRSRCVLSFLWFFGSFLWCFFRVSVRLWCGLRRCLDLCAVRLCICRVGCWSRCGVVCDLFICDHLNRVACVIVVELTDEHLQLSFVSYNGWSVVEWFCHHMMTLMPICLLFLLCVQSQRAHWNTTWGGRLNRFGYSMCSWIPPHIIGSSLLESCWEVAVCVCSYTCSQWWICCQRLHTMRSSVERSQRLVL